MTLNFKSLIQPTIILVLLGIILIPKACNKTESKTQNVKVTLPSVKSDFKKQAPKEVKPEIRYVEKIKYRDKEEPTDETVPKDWLQEFIDAQDNSTKTLALYQDAIRKRKFTDRWEDENFVVELEAEAYGKIDWIKPTVTQKSKEITVPVTVKTEKKVNLYGGVELTNGIKEIAPTIKGEIFIQKPSGNMYSIGINNKKDVSVGYILKF